jgi:hypothetical protein
VGGTTQIALPRLEPRGADHAWGQVVLTKAESLDLQPDPAATGLRPIDPQHDLMPGASVADATRAFEFQSNWSLSLMATRYRLEDVKRTSIERGLVRAVVTRSQRVSVQALYRVRSAVQRLAVQLPENAEFDSDPLRINGRPRALEHGDGDLLYVPLAESPHEAFLLELRYTVPGNHRQLLAPHFPGQAPIESAPAVQKVYLAPFLPEEMVLLGSAGPWTAERELEHQQQAASPLRADRTLIDWVREGTPVPDTQLLSFPTDGRLHLFSALQPPPPPGGALRLRAISRRSLDALLFGTLGLAGVLLLRRSVPTKVAALLCFAGLMVVAGVFTPTLARQILDARSLLAIGVVGLVWLAAGAARYRPRGSRTAAVRATDASSDKTTVPAPAIDAQGDNGNAC